jgi:hypothetical protein
MIMASGQGMTESRGDAGAARHAWRAARRPVSAPSLGSAAARLQRRIRAFGSHLELPAPAALCAVLMVGTLTKGNYSVWAFAAVGFCYVGYVIGRCVLARGRDRTEASEPAVAER